MRDAENRGASAAGKNPRNWAEYHAQYSGPNGSAARPGLQRSLGGFDATTVGVGSMIGAGVFVVLSLAAARAGSWLPLALGIAALIAYCNAHATAQLAIKYPTSGGGYAYGRKQLGQWPGFIAGWGFITGKAASAAAMAYTFGLYAFPGYQRAAAVGAVVVLTGVNLLGITRTAWAARWIVAIVIGILAFVVVAAFSTDLTATAPPPLPEPTAWSVLQAAALLFFAFAGFARIATMGEEVHNPRRNIPLAIFGALAVTFALYALLALSLTHALTAAGLAADPAPMLRVVASMSAGVGTWAVTIAAVLASLGALLALVAGIGRTTFAMAREGDLPRVLATVGQRFKVPWVADLTVAAVVILLLLSTDVLTVVGFSSFGVLCYYALTNAAAFTLKNRRWFTPRWLNALGFAGCLLLAFTLPLPSVLTMLAVFAVGIIGRLLVKGTGRRAPAA